MTGDFSMLEFVAERPMYFSYDGKVGPAEATCWGRHPPSGTWYFAEGYTGEGFDEWLCVLNPGDAAAALTFRFQTQEEGEVTVEGYGVPARSRATFKVDDLLGDGVPGLPHARGGRRRGGGARHVLLLPGRRGAGVDGRALRDGGAHPRHRVLSWRRGPREQASRSGCALQNPGASPISDASPVTVSERGRATRCSGTTEVGAGSRLTVYVPGEVGAEKDVSVELDCGSPFLAERSMYFSYQGTGGRPGEGIASAGAATPAERWFFAEGYTGEWFDEWLCLKNPGDDGVSSGASPTIPRRGPASHPRAHPGAALALHGPRRRGSSGRGCPCRWRWRRGRRSSRSGPCTSGSGESWTAATSLQVTSRRRPEVKIRDPAEGKGYSRMFLNSSMTEPGMMRTPGWMTVPSPMVVRWPMTVPAIRATFSPMRASKPTTESTRLASLPM